ncbi:MAG TPA: alpha/beta hydrolase [Urbifossiella sp.]|nr:alpha/beta hydrolase [Urbifossiella sp.]
MTPGPAPQNPPARAGVPIILLSGMAADERLFAAQVAAFPTLRVQPWVAPLPGESLRAYAARLAPVVDPGRPCLVGGASFGGVVALELAPHLPALGCVLIGSIRSPTGLPRRWRALRRMALPEAISLSCGRSCT